MTDTELMHHIVAMGRQNKHCRRIRVGPVEIEFDHTQDEVTQPSASLKLPPEAAPPDGDALLYYSTPYGPELENEKQGA